MTKETLNDDDSRRWAWATALLGAGATLSVISLKLYQRRLFKEMVEAGKTGLDLIDLEDTDGLGQALRDITATCISYPDGISRDQLKVALKDNRTARRHLGPAIAVMRRDGIVTARHPKDKHPEILVTPQFAAAVLNDPSSADKLLTACAARSDAADPASARAHAEALLMLIPFLPDEVSSYSIGLPEIGETDGEI